MTALLCPLFNGVPVIDASGNPVAGGTIRTFESGTDTPLATWATQAADVANPVQISLDSRGMAEAQIWLSQAVEYRLAIYDAGGSIVGTAYDHVVGVLPYVPPAEPALPPIPPPSTAWDGSLWVLSVFTPVYVSGASFTVTGNHTSTFNDLKTNNRPIRLSVSGGYRAGTIDSATYSAGPDKTTVAMTVDSGTLTAPLGGLWFGGDATDMPIHNRQIRGAWPPDSNLPLGGKKFTGCGAASSGDEFVTKTQADATYAAGGPTAFVKSDGTVPLAADWNVGAKKITNLANAGADTDALNRITADGRYTTQSWVTSQGYATTSYVSGNYAAQSNFAVSGTVVSTRPASNGGGLTVYTNTSGSTLGPVTCDSIVVNTGSTLPLNANSAGMSNSSVLGGFAISSGGTAVIATDPSTSAVVLKDQSGTITYAPIAASAFTVSSSEVLKEDIVDYAEDVHERLCRIKPKRYKLKNTEDRDVGLIAEEVMELFPEAIHEVHEGTIGISLHVLLTMCIKSIQELSARIDRLEKNVK